MKRYNPKIIEPKWQKIWAQSKIYQARDFDKKTKYVMLTEFPYPSGAGLHMGHVREYTLGDILARQKRMAGFNVLYPMGYDAFGLPTENYAIQNKIAPQKATADNIAIFQDQLEALGYGIDWSRSVTTSDPSYYKWTQWLFLQFFKAGLAYQAEVAINWCPFCKTGLADEEVINGRHERCDTLVEKKLIKQWLLKITQYADRLIEGLKTVDYPSRITDQQINWIGRKEGIDITYKLVGAKPVDEIICFTTRPDTNFGATFVVLAPEHSLVQKIIKRQIKPTTGKLHWQAVADYAQKVSGKSELERQEEGRTKTGIFTGLYVKNDLNGKKLPVWVSDFVLVGFGTGALVGVPGHDLRDFEFAQQFDLPIVRVVIGPDGDKSPITRAEQVQEDTGRMVNSEFLNGLDIKQAIQKMMDYMEKHGLGRRKISYRLRDWIFSRQHYWGEPIPIIHCPDHGPVAVPDDQLPVELPAVKHYEPTETGESPLATIMDWVDIKCPICGKAAKRETDTMPNWAGSSWYYLRYFDAHNDKAFADRKKLDYWGAVDMYLGGMEHTTLHLLYSRFWHQFFYDQKLVPTPEPYAARRGQGVILAADGAKMSKSKGNVIDPAEVIASGYGADALRLAIAFLAPYDQTTAWSPESLGGTFRFLQRIWTIVQEYLDEAKSSELKAKSLSDGHNGELETQITRTVHKAIKKVSQDMAELGFNTAIAALMECVNELYKIKSKHNFGLAHQAWHEALSNLVQLLAPFAPHIAEELWADLGYEQSVHLSNWPTYDEQLVKEELITIAVQINGKVRSELLLPADVGENEAIAAAKADVKTASYLKGAKIKKAIYVPGRLVSLVI